VTLVGRAVPGPMNQTTMKHRQLKQLAGRAVLGLALAGMVTAHSAVEGWLSWRGPEQTGASRETGLPAKIGSTEDALWVADFPGGSTPVIANGRLYVVGHLGSGPMLQEGLGCFDAETGKLLWTRLYSDFLSDIIYERYATSNPAVDPETGNVYLQGSQGLLVAFSPDGEELWQHSLMESFGRLTFPNGRTASPVVEDDLVITRGITANWGGEGPGRDRFYAFDKRTGAPVWSSSAGGAPMDSSYSYPYLGWFEGQRLIYATLGDGGVAAMNAGSGDPLWHVQLGKAGINAAVLVHNDDKAIAIYGTPYEPGQMVAFRIPRQLPDGPRPAAFSREELELWSNDISTSTSSPILVGDRIYVVAEKGDLCAVDANTGKVLWTVKLGIEQRNSAPLYADGRLYVPILDNPAGAGAVAAEAGSRGAFYIIEPGETEGRIVTHLVLDGRCFGSPAAYNGKIYLQTKAKLYCFGRPGDNPGRPKPPTPVPQPQPGPPARLQIIPYDVVLHPGESMPLRVRKLDANGRVVGELTDLSQVQWAPFVPPTARVRSLMNGRVTARGEVVADDLQVPSAGAFQATLGDLKGTFRGRVLPYPPFSETFEAFELTEMTTNSVESATPFAYPPLAWIGARVKFEVREKDGAQALTKTIDNKFFQRGIGFIGTPDMSNYTIEAEVLSEGNRRKMSEVGLINQRYLIALKGNDQKIEISSNMERLRVPEGTATPNFRWSPNTWYHLKARVDVAEDGSGVVRAKAWPRGEPEPDGWIIEVPHERAHRQGSPGVYGFAPQEMRVMIDNLRVTPNDP
jgi:outer membrane protein assembly factor BamB